ncbi:MAG: guanylate kinase [Bacteroidota bacterium]
MGKLLVVTAPSGAGKTTIVKHLLKTFDRLAFSVSATTRTRRVGEVEGRDYYYINVSAFKRLIAEGAFVEWEEVYPNQFYGTLKSELHRLWSIGKDIVFDVDVHGAVDLEKVYPENTLTIFVKAPSPEILFERLRNRRSENEESLRKRIEKAAFELTFENRFDVVLVNDVLERTLKEAEEIVAKWLIADC